MSNEVVKYHNDLNTVLMRTWTPQEMNLFFSIVAKSRERGTQRLYFNTNELKELTKFADEHSERWETTMRNAINKISQLNYVEQLDHKIRAMTLFSWLEVDLNNQTLEVQVSEQFEYILNKISANFTTWELEEFVTLRSSYSKVAYRLLKQWRTIGKKEFTINEFRLAMDMPKSYRPSEIKKRVLKPIINELEPYFKDLKVKTLKKNTQGTPVTGYLFTWKPEQTQPWIENKYDEKPQEYAPKYEDKFTEWLINYGVLSTHDHELIEQFKLEVYPSYQQLADRSTLDTVEKHISYVAKQHYTHPVGYFKKAAKDYLKRFI
ncbi:RepB family plasmid replication initiator protein [Aerococcus urinaeequi]|uniref:RepB family plasmid replication initiator protein n=1 Tax=Aerococcus urinaeequi TaxID=51665 RepID=UPI003D6B65C6